MSFRKNLTLETTYYRKIVETFSNCNVDIVYRPSKLEFSKEYCIICNKYVSQCRKNEICNLVKAELNKPYSIHYFA